jgi:hypothetical protein
MVLIKQRKTFYYNSQLPSLNPLDIIPPRYGNILHSADPVGMCILAVGSGVSCLPQRETKTGFWVHTFGAGKDNKVLFVSQIMIVLSGNKSVSNL